MTAIFMSNSPVRIRCAVDATRSDCRTCRCLRSGPRPYCPASSADLAAADLCPVEVPAGAGGGRLASKVVRLLVGNHLYQECSVIRLQQMRLASPEIVMNVFCRRCVARKKLAICFTIPKPSESQLIE